VEALDARLGPRSLRRAEARKVLAWIERCELARAFLWEGNSAIKGFDSSAPIVLCCAGHEGTFSQIQPMELFQTTNNAYI
jgi:hypothetical protein